MELLEQERKRELQLRREKQVGRRWWLRGPWAA